MRLSTLGYDNIFFVHDALALENQHVSALNTIGSTKTRPTFSEHHIWYGVVCIFESHRNDVVIWSAQHDVVVMFHSKEFAKSIR